MYTERTVPRTWLLCLTLSFAVLLIPAFGDDVPDRQQIKARMQAVMALDDMEDDAAIAQWKSLIALGDSAYPVLAELLEERKDAVGVARILGIFVEGKGDKRVAVNATKKLLRRAPAETDASVRIEAVNALAQIATTNDASAFVPLMADPSEAVRVNVMRALSKLGTTNELAHIEEYLTLRKAQMSQDDLQKDQSFHEAQKALNSVKKRVAEIKPGSLIPASR